MAPAGVRLMSASRALMEAIEALWRIPRPGPDNLLSAPRFTVLAEICNVEYGGGKPTFALSGALRSLGLPCDLPKAQAHLAMAPDQAAKALADTGMNVRVWVLLATRSELSSQAADQEEE